MEISCQSTKTKAKNLKKDILEKEKLTKVPVLNLKMGKRRKKTPIKPKE